ncbi:hypothetical protein GIB67_042746, partial [Kingdonia uniflora]
MRGICAGRNSLIESVLKMGRSSVNEVLTSGRTNDPDNEGEGGLEQFLGFPGQLVSYPLGSDTFREFCKAKGWERENKVRRITPEDILQFYGVKNFKASRGSYFCASVTQRRFFDLNLAGRILNDNIIWVKGKCLQRDDEKLLDLRFRSIKQSVKSTGERKKSLLDEVAEEETELELVLGELGQSRKKRVESKSKKVAKAQSTRSMTGVDKGTIQTNGEEIRAKTPGSGRSAQPNLTTGKIAQRFPKRQIKKALPASGTTISGEVAQGKRKRVEPLGGLGEKVTEGRSVSVDDLKKIEERAKLAILQGKEDTSQMVEFDASHVREDHTLMCNREFTEQFDKVKEANENREDQYVKTHFKLEKLNQVVSNLARQVEEKESGIKMRLKDLSEATKRAENLQRQVDALAVKAERDQAIARTKKVEARERSGGSRTVINAPLVQGDVGHAQRGNADLREYQHKLDAALIREKILEGEIRAKDLLVKRKDELLKDLPAREELKAELGMLRAQ